MAQPFCFCFLRAGPLLNRTRLARCRLLRLPRRRLPLSPQVSPQLNPLAPGQTLPAGGRLIKIKATTLARKCARPWEAEAAAKAEATVATAAGAEEVTEAGGTAAMAEAAGTAAARVKEC